MVKQKWQKGICLHTNISMTKSKNRWLFIVSIVQDFVDAFFGLKQTLISHISSKNSYITSIFNNPHITPRELCSRIVMSTFSSSTLAQAKRTKANNRSSTGHTQNRHPAHTSLHQNTWETITNRCGLHRITEGYSQANWITAHKRTISSFCVLTIVCIQFVLTCNMPWNQLIMVYLENKIKQIPTNLRKRKVCGPW